VPLDRFWAAWREQYVSGAIASLNAGDTGECVFCVLSNEEVAEASGVLYQSETTFVVLNAYPYGSGHLLVLPRRHVATIAELSDEEYQRLLLGAAPHGHGDRDGLRGRRHEYWL
jgi:ATP adenylyltransferase